MNFHLPFLRYSALLISDRETNAPTMKINQHNFWVFGYGSLMWRPDFPHIDAQRARVHGYHRSLCALSTGHRGTKDKPSLIVGLDRGGACIGRAYRVAPKQTEEVADYLRSREMKSGVYEPHHITIVLPTGEKTKALTYAVCRSSPLYTRKLPFGRQVELVLQGQGMSGTGLEYLESMVAHLDEMGISCEQLRAVLKQALIQHRS
jgi:cation transport protein ChaC